MCVRVCVCVCVCECYVICGILVPRSGIETGLLCSESAES